MRRSASRRQHAADHAQAAVGQGLVEPLADALVEARLTGIRRHHATQRFAGGTLDQLVDAFQRFASLAGIDDLVPDDEAAPADEGNDE